MYKFLCLLFGLTRLSGALQRCLKPVVGFLWSMGVQCVIYMEDILMHGNKQDLRGQRALALGLLEALGFLVNYPSLS